MWWLVKMIELTLRNLPLPKGPEMGQHFETAENLLLVSWWYNWKKSCATFDPAPSRSINVHDSPAPVLKRKLGMTFFLKVSAHECWPRSLPRVSGEIWPWTDLCSLWFPAQVGCLVEVSPVPGGGREILSGKGSWGPEITARRGRGLLGGEPGNRQRSWWIERKGLYPCPTS